MKTSKEKLRSLHLGNHQFIGIIREIRVDNITFQMGSDDHLTSIRLFIDTEDDTRLVIISKGTLVRLCRAFGPDLSKWFGKRIKLYGALNQQKEWRVRIYPIN